MIVPMSIPPRDQGAESAESASSFASIDAVVIGAEPLAALLRVASRELRITVRRVAPFELPTLLADVGQRVDLVIVDLGALGHRSASAIMDVRRRWPEAGIVSVAMSGGVASAVEAFRAGADDHLDGSLAPRSLAPSVARALSNRAVRRIRRVREAAGRASHRRLMSLAMRDSLSSLWNRRYFDLRIRSEIARAARLGTSMSLGLLDLDGFKQVNDSLGHPAGDRLIALMGEILHGCCRSYDVPCRLGGDEFALILPETDLAGGVEAIEDIRSTLSASLALDEDSGGPSVTVSAGVAAVPVSATSVGELLGAADQALYAAKRHGRNRVVSAPVRPARPTLERSARPSVREGGGSA